MGDETTIADALAIGFIVMFWVFMLVVGIKTGISTANRKLEHRIEKLERRLKMIAPEPDEWIDLPQPDATYYEPNYAYEKWRAAFYNTGPRPGPRPGADA